MYKNYIFDLYGTLIDIHTDENCIDLWQEMAEFYSFKGANYTADELKDRYNYLCKEEEQLHIKKYKNITHHEINITNVFKKLYTEKNVTVSKQSLLATAQFFRIMSTKRLGLYSGVIAFLENLKKNGKKIYLLSNAQYDFTYYELLFLNIEHYFDGILISSNEKVKKPDPMFYQILFDKYLLNKNESIMIGNDKSTDIKGANDFGIDSLYLYSNISPMEDKDSPSFATYTLDNVDYKKVAALILKN